MKSVLCAVSLAAILGCPGLALASPPAGAGNAFQVQAAPNANSNGARVSRAATRSTTAIAMVPKKQLEQLLPDDRMKLMKLSSGKDHPLVLDFSHIGNGEAMLGGMPARNIASLWGIFAPAVAGVIDKLGELGGNYSELIAGIPVTVGTKSFLYVPGMYLNGKTGYALEKMAGYGYNKQLVDIDHQPFQRFAASTNGHSLVEAEYAPRGDFRGVHHVDEMQLMTPLLSLPMLGHVGGERYAISHLHRTIDDPRGAARAAPAVATIRVSKHSFLAPVTALSGKGKKVAAVMLDGAHTDLDLPKQVRLSDLAR